MACPGQQGTPCSGHGKCVTMEALAKDEDHFQRFTYELAGASSFAQEMRSYSSVWDAKKVQGCVCDYPFTGHDCSLRQCPSGDDPLTTGQRDEVQIVECQTTYHHQIVRLYAAEPLSRGTFSLQFGADRTRPMPFNVSAHAVDGTNVSMASRLRALPGGVASTVEVHRSGANQPVWSEATATSTADSPTFVLRKASGTPATEDPDDGVAYSWNISWSEGAETQRLLVPLFKQTEVQALDCSATRKGYVSLSFPGFPPAGAGAASCQGACTGVDTTGTRLAREVSEHGDHLDSVVVSTAATAPELEAALVEGLTVLEAVAVNYSAPGGALCTPEGNTAYVTLVRTRLDAEHGGDLPPLKAVPTSSGVKVVPGGGQLREVVKGFDSCTVPEVQSILCQAASGKVNVTLSTSPSSVLLDAGASPRAVERHLEALDGVVDVTVEYSDGDASLCTEDGSNDVEVTFHAVEPYLLLDDSGDLPELDLDISGLVHPGSSVVATSPARELVKGLRCVPLDQPRRPPTAPGRGHQEDQAREASRQLTVSLPAAPSDGGAFALRFFGQVSPPVSATATADEVRAALEAIPAVEAVAVAFGGHHACERPANIMAVTFLGNFGPLPALKPVAVAMPNHSLASLAVRTGGERDSVSGQWGSVNGTKENDVCSHHGLCRSDLGVCDCFRGEKDLSFHHSFTSSDGRGGPGTRGDCGYEISPQGDPRSVWHVDGRAAAVPAFDQAGQLSPRHQLPAAWGQGFPSTGCPGELACSGHGHCSGPPAYRCHCARGWAAAADCSERECPRGAAWFDYPLTADDSAHTSFVECSNRGTCDRQAGECRCEPGFTGAACQLTVCPGRQRLQLPGRATAGLECSGHGRCLTMRQLSHLAATLEGEDAGLDYGSDPSNPAEWDALRLRGCYCDDGYTGADCSERLCPVGDDPNTSQDVDEVQLLNCTANGGTFTLSFGSVVGEDGRRGPATTAPIPFNASAKDLQAALEALESVQAVEVAYSASGGAACNAPGGSLGGLAGGSNSTSNTIAIRFTQDTGRLPPLRPDNASLIYAPAGADDGALAGGSGVVHVATGGDRMGGQLSVTSTREALECSGRGLCDRTHGVCQCFSGYASSDGMGGRGVRGDCGYRVADKLLLRGGGAAGSSADGGALGSSGHGSDEPHLQQPAAVAAAHAAAAAAVADLARFNLDLDSVGAATERTGDVADADGRRAKGRRTLLQALWSWLSDDDETKMTTPPTTTSSEQGAVRSS
uniref:EGF-like domain-containing protein n=1 Tax=Rhizochromulina marina TaxID=1034831 RepID=A0A7S2W9D6_9STRA